MFANKTNIILPVMNELALRRDADVFRITDLDFFKRRLTFWRHHLPRVKPFYAVKTNHDKPVVAELASLGMGFDCASIREVIQLLELGVTADRIIFANPFKSIRTINFLKEQGIKRLVFDCEDELLKLIEHFPSAEIVLRLLTDDVNSEAPLSMKFGSPCEVAKQLIDLAIKKQANLFGISFHVGSNCAYAPSYEKALRNAASIISYAKEKHGAVLRFLDVGGGFPGANDEAFVEIAKVVNQTIAEVIADDVEIIAEPGSFFATQSMSALVRVIGQKNYFRSNYPEQELYLATGVYGLFYCGFFKKYDAAAIYKYGWEFRALSCDPNSELVRTTLWGPTCDATDKIVENIMLPRINSGGWIYSHNVGAYTFAIEGDFNQIDRATPFYIRSDAF